MAGPKKILQAVFFLTKTGKQPVRDWLMDMDRDDRKSIGEDIATLEFCWPIGKPKCSPIVGVKGLYEIRSNISDGRIARVFFVLIRSEMVLLHAFIKKTQKTPAKELDLATARMKEVQSHEKEPSDR
jgi:phage-related protein